ncbi:MAG: DEAD/DEAH box helicase family protein [Candidatus Thiodiazotropha sp.]
MNVIEDQWQYLAQIKKLSRPKLNKLLSQISPNGNLISEQNVTDTRPPWEITAKPRPLVLENPPQQVTITLANHIYFEVKALPSALLARLRRIASFSNPVFFKTQALRFSTHGIPRFISCARIEQGYLSLPRGCLDDALILLKENNIGIQIDDKRELGTKLSGIKPLLTLRKNQQTAVKQMTKHDTGILHASTAFGKTVTAIGMIAKRNTNTLILVHSRQLLDQWQERLRSFFTRSGDRRHQRGKEKAQRNH